MAWSPPARQRRSWLVEQAGDYATTRFHHLRDGTAPNTCKPNALIAQQAKSNCNVRARLKRSDHHEALGASRPAPPYALCPETLLKRALSSTLHVSARSRNAKPLLALKAHSRNGLSPRPGDDSEIGETRPCRGLAQIGRAHV